jgi:hypothetical protein
VDKDHIRTHIHNLPDENEMKFMYALGEEGNIGIINGLYTFYSVLNRLFRKTICPRDGDPINISQFAKSLLAHMRDGAPPFSVMDFVWEEIKGISMNPQKTCRFVPYLIFMIEDVTNRIFLKDGFHMPIRPTPSNKPIVPPCSGLLSSKTRSHSSAAAEPVRPVHPTGQTGLGDQGQSSA